MDFSSDYCGHNTHITIGGQYAQQPKGSSDKLNYHWTNPMEEVMPESCVDG